MAPGTNGANDDGGHSSNTVDGQHRSPRHPRWTRQETLVLIEAKRVAEERGRRGRRSSYVFGSNQVEPKWDYVSSYCKEHGVSRGSVQCRKRWSNLVSDFKKIKAWDSQAVGGEGEGEGFWMMRSDLRRERKLPGFFDREVFDVLDGKAYATDPYQLALVTTSEDGNNGNFVEAEAEAEDEDEMAEDGSIPSPIPISEMRVPPSHPADSDRENRRQSSDEYREGAKRRRHSSSEYRQHIDMNVQLMEALVRNTNLVNVQLENQNLNNQLNREQQKEQHNSLIASLTKVTDVLEKIANKL